MDAADIFRQGLGSVIPRQPQHFFPKRPPQIPQYPYLPQPPEPLQHQVRTRDEASDNDAAPNRIVYTLSACCRCRQRKTRCDPTLPRCLPCERSGAICEYFDTTKGRKISRSYVVKLQERLRQLEAELAQYVEEGGEYPDSNEEIVRPGGLVRLNETDETPRYLGPSSGIAMTRLVMEQAKRYTESKQISELIPEVRARRTERMNRMESIVSFRQSLAGSSSRKSYPMTSAHPAEILPTRPIADKLAQIYNQRAQVFTPTLHEKVLLKDVDAVFNGDTDPYKNFVVRMVMAISLQKLDTQYAGLADSYYLAAMQYFEDVVRPKDLRTLQCLILIGQYSLLTPTRTAVYFVIGLATRICQQLGLGEEKTLTAGYDMGLVDPLTMDMRRRLAWIVATNEYGLSQSMGRPNGFSKTDDLLDVKFFATVDDENITEEGIKPGESCGKKLVSIHFCKMRILQAEIRRVLYERSLPEKPRHENHPWFAAMEEKIKTWLNSSPEKPEWCRPWFTGRYHTIVITLYRPSPQVPKPTGQAALRCYESAAYIITLSSQQVKKAAIDITWVFLLTLYMALNTILWTLTYSEVRNAHVRDEVEELVNVALDIIEQCSERWPGTAAASQLYAVFSRACMQSYEPNEDRPNSNFFAASPSYADASSPSTSESSAPTSVSTNPPAQRQAPPTFNHPQFGYVFDAAPEPMHVGFTFDQDPPPFHNAQPTFRSNSIFAAPASDSQGRRFSYFPPDFTQAGQTPLSDQSDEPTPPSTRTTPYNPQASPSVQSPFFSQSSPLLPLVASSLPSPPESSTAPSISSNRDRMSPISTLTTQDSSSPAPLIPQSQSTPALLTARQSPMLMPSLKQEPLDWQNPLNHIKQERSGMSGRQPFAIPPPAHTRQRPLPPATITDWFSPPPPFISPYAFSSGMGGGYWGDGSGAPGPASAPFSALGLDIGPGPGGGYNPPRTNGLPYNNDFANMFGGQDTGMAGMQYALPNPERQGSLSHQQQIELMDVLETEGLGEIDAFLQAPVGLSGSGMEGVRWTQ